MSQSAVSRAFSRVPTESSVSKETKERILKAARELGYQPNAIARSLITKRSHMVALLFSYLDNPFYALALERFCLALQQKGYHALVFMMPSTDEGVEETVHRLLEYQVDGIITASVELSSTLCEACSDQGIPVVMFNRFQDVDSASSVTTDNILGGRMAADHLVETGHQKIAMISGWQRSSTSRDRQTGFEAALAQSGKPLFRHEIGHFDLAETRAATLRLFDVPVANRPDSVFIANDYMALESMSVMRDVLKIRIPDDVSVIGFDDIPQAAQPEFLLTTLHQPLDRMVELATDHMIDTINNPDMTSRDQQLSPELVERSSVRLRTA